MESLNIKRYIIRLVNIFGYKITRNSKELPKDMDKKFKNIHKECKNYTMTSIERMYTLYKAVEYVISSKISGDFVECGVWKGGSSMIMAKTLLNLKENNRKLYLYDTFTGMPKPSEKDSTHFETSPTLKTWEKNQKKEHNTWAYSALNKVKSNMKKTKYPQKNIIYIKGKVEDTIPNIIPTKIAILRLDTDWYESTYHELIHLFPLLSNGGVLIIDDYGYWKGAKEAVDKYLKEKNIRILLNRIDNTGRIGIKINSS